MDTIGSSIFGLRSINPYNLPIIINPLVPYNIYQPAVPSILRGDLQSVPINLRDVYTKPVTLIVKSSSGAEGLTACILENGLSSLAENPQTRAILDMIRTGSDKTAVVVQPTALYNTPAFRILKDMPVVKIEVPSGIKLANLININTPYVLIHDKEDVTTSDLDGLIRVGSLDIAEEKLVCSSC